MDQVYKARHNDEVVYLSDQAGWAQEFLLLVVFCEDYWYHEVHHDCVDKPGKEGLDDLWEHVRCFGSVALLVG